MLIKKTGYPEKSDLVICTVTKIQFNSIFVRLDEYEKRQGIIHISEISPGRIRNIRDYVKEGKVIVCVVLRVNSERDLIELSLRRVTDSQRRNKINQMKQEQKAEKIIEFVAKQKGIEDKELLDKIVKSITPDYPAVHAFFEDVVFGHADIERLKLDKDTLKLLEETIRQRIKPPEVFIKGRFVLKSFQPEGIEDIKKALKAAEDIGKDDLTLLYLGAGKYDLSLRAPDYKSAEKLLEGIKDKVESMVNKAKGQYEFERTDR